MLVDPCPGTYTGDSNWIEIGTTVGESAHWFPSLDPLIKVPTAPAATCTHTQIIQQYQLLLDALTRCR